MVVKTQVLNSVKIITVICATKHMKLAFKKYPLIYIYKTLLSTFDNNNAQKIQVLISVSFMMLGVNLLFKDL